MTSSAAVSIQGVSKSYRIYTERNQSLKATLLRGKRSAFEEFWALKDISLEIPKGTTFGLMGHNGSGKSTLLKCIAKILQPNAGHIESSGRMASMLELGSGFHPELTGRENVYLNGSILGMSRKELDAKFDAIADFAGIGAFIDQPVKNYSSGMYVRLGFSVAIHVEPEILLADEILAVGDMKFQEKCHEKFAQFKDEGRTVIIVSHGLGDLRTMCDRAAWLDSGRLVDVGPAGQIVDEYIDSGHDARPVATGGMRFGSGDIEIGQIEMLDRSGLDLRQFRTGDEVTIRLHWNASRPVVRPIFEMSLTSLEGVKIWSHHTWDAEYIPSVLRNSGTIDVHIPELRLQPGTFDLNTMVTDESRSTIFDQWSKAVRLDVTMGRPRESGGLIVMGSNWGNLQPPTEMSIARNTSTARSSDSTNHRAAHASGQVS